MIRDGHAPDAIDEAVRVLHAGGLVAFPTETVYGLGADAGNDAAVAGIFAAKGRPSDHPLIVHVAAGELGTEALSHFAQPLPLFAQKLVGAFWPGPLTLIVARQPDIAASAAGGQDTIGVRCPSHPVAQTLLFIAGGTGIAPLRSMIRHVLETRRDATIHVLYSARSSREFAYLPELRGLARDGALDLRLTLTGKASRWPHARGRIDAVQLAPLVDVADTMAFICGPPLMLTGVTAALMDLGVSRDRVKTETW